MNQTPKEQLEMLLNFVLPSAQKFLEKYGELIPFVAVMFLDGRIRMITTYHDKQSILNFLDENHHIQFLTPTFHKR